MVIYLRTIFPSAKKVTRKKVPDVKVPDTARNERKKEYKHTQSLWTKNPCRCLRALLKYKNSEYTPSKEVMMPFWETIMTQDEVKTPGTGTRKEVCEDLWFPVTTNEILKSFPERGTAPGPDGITARQLRSVPSEILVRILNIFMLIGKLPEYLLESKTTLIPKKDGANEPGDFRPLTVSPVVVRSFHKILAARILKHLEIDERQKAFRQIDGCAENIFLTDAILRLNRAAYKSTYMASMDMAKAFDSVTHKAIEDTMVNRGFPIKMVEYIMSTYHRSQTRLACDGWVSDLIHPSCGVKQGDPLSPLLFILVIERMLEALPEEVGVDIGHLKINAEAFADDIIFFASTPIGLQTTIDAATQFLSECGLYINVNKCFTISIEGLGHEHKSAVNAQRRFTCQGRELPAQSRSSVWKYLGVQFTAAGCTAIEPLKKLNEFIKILTKAPLKPQQRVFGMKNVVLPGLYHQLTLSRITIGTLKKADKITRVALKKWLNLPHDVPTAYFHADVADGGLGIPSMRWNMPVIRLSRLRNLSLLRTNVVSQVTNWVDKEISTTLQRLEDQGEAYTNSTAVSRRWRKLLYASVDGAPLKGSNRIPQQHRWVAEGNRLVSGKDYINMMKFRINAMPVRARTTRGRTLDRRCRGGCPASETLNHVIQQCHRTHGARIKRHNAIVNYLARSMGRKWSYVAQEPKFNIRNVGIRKPDLLATEGDAALVIDVCIPSEQADLATAHREKVDYYKILEDNIKKRYNVSHVTFSAAAISSRGLWCSRSCQELLDLNVIKKSEIKIISTRVLIGGIYAHNIFNKMTTTTARRTGIG